MKTKLRIAGLLVLAVFSLALAAVPAAAQGIGLLYDNGPWNSYYAGVQTSTPIVITNQMQLTDNGFGGRRHYVNSFSFPAWVISPDTVGCVTWSIDTQPFGTLHNPSNANHHYGGGTACSPTDVSSVLLWSTVIWQDTWDIYEVTVSFPDVNLPPETLNGCPSCSLGAPTVYLTIRANSSSGGLMGWQMNNAKGALGNNGSGGGVSNTAYSCDLSKGPTCNAGNANVQTLTYSESFSVTGYDQ